PGIALTALYFILVRLGHPDGMVGNHRPRHLRAAPPLDRVVGHSRYPHPPIRRDAPRIPRAVGLLPHDDGAVSGVAGRGPRDLRKLDPAKRLGAAVRRIPADDRRRIRQLGAGFPEPQLEGTALQVDPTPRIGATYDGQSRALGE